MHTPRFASISLAAVLSLGCGAAQQPAATTPTASSPASNAPHRVAFGDLRAAVAGPQRSVANRARDRYRHPAETLALFGVQPGQTVVELAPGAGWYTEILAPLLHDDGHLIEATGDPANPNAHGAQQFAALLHAHPEVFGNVQTVLFDPPNSVNLGPDNSADVVLTFRNLHNWIASHSEAAVLAAAFRVLKPGGVLGMVEHRAHVGADIAVSAHNGYVPTAHVIELAHAAGFVLDFESEINANPQDNTDHPDGVWDLPPVLRGGDVNREAMLAIGESDRMTLRFRKPASSHWVP